MRDRRRAPRPFPVLLALGGLVHAARRVVRDVHVDELDLNYVEVLATRMACFRAPPNHTPRTPRSGGRRQLEKRLWRGLLDRTSAGRHGLDGSAIGRGDGRIDRHALR